MGKFNDYVDTTGFSIKDIDTSGIEDIISWLPKSGVFDLNIAEQGLIKSLHAENNCQEHIAKLDRYIALRESDRAAAWADAALNKAAAAGHKTAKDKEWFACADPTYIAIINDIQLAKTAKKWFENKADYFRDWHYAFKTFLKRDYSLERLGNSSEMGYNSDALEERSIRNGSDFGGDIEWK